jgi:cytochrome c oxidase subunit 7
LPPIVGKLRRQILLDISVGFGIGMTMGYMFWYGYHVPAVRRRDAYYEKLEREKIAKFGCMALSLILFAFALVALSFFFLSFLDGIVVGRWCCLDGG